MADQNPSQAGAETENNHGAARTGSRRPRTRTLLVAGVIVAIAVGAFFYFHYAGRTSTDDAEIAGHIQPMAPRVAGTVIAVDVNDYQMVSAGQVLFRLDPKPYEDALHQAEANLRAAQAAASSAQTAVPITSASSHGTLSGAEAALRSAQAGEQASKQQLAVAQARYQAARANVAEAQAAAQDAVTTEHRYAQLAAKQEISQLQYQQAQTRATADQAAVRAAQANEAAAQQQIADANAQIQVAQAKVAQAAAGVNSAATAPEQIAGSRAQARLAQAKVAQAEAAVAMAQLNLDYTTITAPTAGQIGDKHVELGQAFSPGQTALVVVPVNDVWVIANYKETELAQMHAGQPAQISVDAFGVTLQGKVLHIGAGTGSVFSLLPPENATGNYVKVVQRVPVKIVFNPGQNLSRLRPGMSVEATVFSNK